MSTKDIVMAAAGAIGIQYVGGTTAQSAASTQTTVSLTSLTGGIASQPSIGDLVVVYFGFGSGTDNSLSFITSGYNVVAELYSNDTYDANLCVGYKYLTTAETQVVTSAPPNSSGGAVAVQVWRNVDDILPLDVNSTTATGGNSILCNPPSITPLTSGAVILAGGMGASNTANVTFTSSDLSSFLTAGGPTAVPSNSNNGTVGLGYKIWTSGAFDPAAFGASITDSPQFSWAAVTLALRPTSTQNGPFLISSANASGNSTSLVINKPTGTREGDLMFANMSIAKSLGWTQPSGWTEISDGTIAGTAFSYKVAGSSEGSNYTFTPSSSSSGSASVGAIVTYRNGLYDALGTAATSGSDPIVVPAVTVGEAFSRVYAYVTSGTGTTITPPSGMNTIADLTGAGIDFLLAQDSQLVPSGSSGTRSFSISNTSNSGILASIKPATSYTKYANYIASASASTTVGNLAITNPTIVPGNVLICFVSIAVSGPGTYSASLPSGYTELASSTATGTNVCAVKVGYRVADGTEGATTTASTTFSGSGSAAASQAALIVVGGVVNSSAPTISSVSTGSSTTSIDANAVTATLNGLLLFLGAAAVGSSGAPTFTSPSGYTEIIDVGYDGNQDGGITVAYKEGNSAGTTGTVTATVSSSGNVKGFLVNIEAQ